MAIEIPGQMVTYPAGSTNLEQFTFVGMNTSGQVVRPSAGAPIVGVLQNKPNSNGTDDGPAASVMLNGVSKIKAPASTLSIGDLVATSTAGYAIPPSAGHYTVGRIVNGSSGGAGRILSVQIDPIGTT